MARTKKRWFKITVKDKYGFHRSVWSTDVLHCYGKPSVHVYRAWLRWALVYAPGEDVQAPQGSKLFVFDTREHAEGFARGQLARGWTLWECEVYGRPKRAWCTGSGGVQGYEKFWSLFTKLEKEEEALAEALVGAFGFSGVAPTGTYFVDGVRLLRMLRVRCKHGD